MAIDIAMYARRGSIFATALAIASCGGRVQTDQTPDSITSSPQKNPPPQLPPSGTASAPASNPAVRVIDIPPPPFDASSGLPSIEGGAIVVPEAATPQPLVDVYVMAVVRDAEPERAAMEGGPPISSCTDLIVTGTPVQEFNQLGPAPNLGLGGTIVDGVYDLTKFIFYVSSNPGPFNDYDREIIRISKSGTLLEYRSDGVPQGMGITLAPQGASLNDKELCPGDLGNMFIGPFYTATGDEFISQNAYYQKVFKKRP
jgi:hypothetical protein